MGLFDRVSGNGYAVRSKITNDELKEFDLVSWGRETVRGGKTYTALALGRLRVSTKTLQESSYIAEMLSNPRLLNMHINAFYSACEILRVCGQSQSPEKIFDQLAVGARAAVSEWVWLFKEYPDEEYRAGLFEYLYRYSHFMLKVLSDQSGSTDERLAKTAERGTAALVTQLVEHYPYPAQIDDQSTPSNPDKAAQLNLTFGVVDYYAEMIVQNSNIMLMK
jgi:hypothetical protein